MGCCENHPARRIWNPRFLGFSSHCLHVRADMLTIYPRGRHPPPPREADRRERRSSVWLSLVVLSVRFLHGSPASDFSAPLTQNRAHTHYVGSDLLPHPLTERERGMERERERARVHSGRWDQPAGEIIADRGELLPLRGLKHQVVNVVRVTFHHLGSRGRSNSTQNLF